MSSPTDLSSAAASRRLRRATRRAHAARVVAAGAAAVGVALVGAFLYQAGFYAYVMPRIAAPVPHIEDPGQITSYGSTLTGSDKNGQPYEIAATRSWQDKDMAHVFHLERMQATLHRPAGKPYRMTGNTARYDSQTKLADIEGAVSIVEEGRFTARMDKAHIDMKDNSLKSDVAVKVELPQGTIAANGMQITGDGATILFLNGVKAHFGSPAKFEGATP